MPRTSQITLVPTFGDPAQSLKVEHAELLPSWMERPREEEGQAESGLNRKLVTFGALLLYPADRRHHITHFCLS